MTAGGPKWTVIVSPDALRVPAENLGRDRAGVAALFDALDTLADDPEPALSEPWQAGARRLRVGAWHALYETDAGAATVTVGHIGRSPGPGPGIA